MVASGHNNKIRIEVEPAEEVSDPSRHLADRKRKTSKQATSKKRPWSKGTMGLHSGFGGVEPHFTLVPTASADGFTRRTSVLELASRSGNVIVFGNEQPCLGSIFICRPRKPSHAEKSQKSYNRFQSSVVKDVR